jgi:hypothetical protein
MWEILLAEQMCQVLKGYIGLAACTGENGM